MKLTSTIRAFAFTGAFAIFATTSSLAAVVADGTPFDPGVPLTGTANFGGSVIGDITIAFAEDANTPANFTGTLRSVAVLNGGGTLDFYYQIGTVAQGDIFDPDIFRLVINQFDPFATGIMDYSTNGLAGIAGAGAFVVGTNAPKTADRDPMDGAGVGFGFASDPGAPIGDPNNLNTGDTSFFMIVRSNASEAVFGTAQIQGFGISEGVQTLVPTSLAVIPEPGSALIGIAVLGVCGSGLFRRQRVHA